MTHTGDTAATPPPPPGSESERDRTRVILAALGGLLAVLLIALLFVLLNDSGGDDTAAESTTTSIDESTTTTVETTTTTAATTTTTTEATTTTAATTTTTTEATTTTAATTTTTMVNLPSFVTADCISYDPASLIIEDLGATGWRLNAGSSALLLYDSEADALRGRAIAQNHRELCFIGRGNSQADPQRYIHEFWHGDSGNEVAIPGPEDCLPYDPTNLAIADVGGGVWRLNDGSSAMASYDGEPDALAGMTLAEAFTDQCFIGRGNTRADRLRYIREYWR